MKQSIVVVLFSLLIFASCKTSNLFTNRGDTGYSMVLDSVFLPDTNYEYRNQKNDKKH